MLPASPAQWSLIAALNARLDETPAATFLFERHGVRLSFAQVAALAGHYATTLQSLGVCEGDRVVIFSADSLSSAIAWFATSPIGAIEVPIHAALVGEPLRHVLRKVQPALVLAEAGLIPVVRTALEALDAPPAIAPLLDPREIVMPPRVVPFPLKRGGGDTASLLFTSGTSGAPKAAIVTEAQALLTGRLMVEKLAIGCDDVFYCAHPMYHMAAKHCVVLAALLSGAAVCLDRRFEAAQWLDRIRESGATVTISHGPMLEMIFDQPARPDDAGTALRAFITSPFPRRIAAAFEQRFGVGGLEVWGMTEMGIPCWSKLDEPLRPGTCGLAAAPWFEVGLLDAAGKEVADGEVGELCVRPMTPELISPGYWGETAPTRADGWARSGDLGRRTDGLLSFVDRASHRIRRRAESISASQIEDAALTHPAVEECAVVGVPSGLEGDDDIKLFYVVRQGTELGELELLKHLAAALPHFMLPRHFARLARLPRTATQKVRRDAVLQDTSPSWDRQAAGVRVRSLTAQSST